MNHRIIYIFIIILLSIQYLYTAKFQAMDAYYINVGSQTSYTDGDGNVWQPDVTYTEDRGYGYAAWNDENSDSNITSVTVDISNTDDDAIYQTNRYGPYLEYLFDVPSAKDSFADGGGYYKVTLKFAETFWDAADRRKFRLYFNDINQTYHGYRIMENADIYAWSGGKNQAYDWTVPVFPVNEGQLKVTLYGDADNAFISGIAVERVPYQVGDIGMTDAEFVDKMERAVFNWFYENSGIGTLPPAYGANNAPDYGWGSSISSIGPCIAIMCIGHYRGWITYGDAYARVENLLDITWGLDKDSKYGAYWHYYNRYYPYHPLPEYDPVKDITDNGNLIVGTIMAQEYFRGTPIELKARQIQESLDFNQFYVNQGYAEWEVGYVCAAGSPRSSTHNSAMVDAFNNASPWGAMAMYFFQWHNLYFDFRHATTTRGNSIRCEFDVARSNTLTLRNNMITDWRTWPDEYNTYDWDAWGITAATHMSDGDYGIADAYGDPGGDLSRTRRGNLNPFAPVASLCFAPTEVLRACKHMYWRFYKLGYPEYMGHGIWNDRYGFVQTYNIGSVESVNGTWSDFFVSNANGGFDYGPQVLACENYRSGLVWHYYRYSDVQRRAFNNIGMTGYDDPVPTAISQNKSGNASSEVGNNTVSNAFDDDKITRWESDASDPQWIYVDLGSQQDIGTVVLWWENAFASKYTIDISNDASSWTTVYTENSGDGGVDRIFLRPLQSARYVRMKGTERGTSYGYSLWMFEVFNKDLGSPDYIDDFEDNDGKNRVFGNMGSWGSGTINYNYETDINAGKVYDGAKALWISYDVSSTGADAGYYTELKHYDMRIFNYISFWVKGQNGAEKFKVRLKSSDEREYGVLITDLISNEITTSWQHVLIPLSKYTGEIDFTDVSNFNIYFENSNGTPTASTIYIDEIRFFINAEYKKPDSISNDTGFNLLLNYGFEDGDGVNADNWSNWGEIGRESWAKGVGDYGYACYSWKTDQTGGFFQDITNINTGMEYMFSIYAAKEENFSADSVMLKFEYFDINDNQISNTIQEIGDSLTQDWREYYIIDSVPDNTNKIRVVVEGNTYHPISSTSAALFFDMAKLIPVYIDDFESNDNLNRLGGDTGTTGSGILTGTKTNQSGLVYDGNYSYQINYDVSNSNDEIEWFTELKHYDAGNFRYLTFFVKGDVAGIDFDIKLTSTNNKKLNRSIDLYLPNGVNTQWQQVLVPLEHFSGSVDINDLIKFGFVFSRGTACCARTIYIDNIHFIVQGDTVVTYEYPTINISYPIGDIETNALELPLRGSIESSDKAYIYLNDDTVLVLNNITSFDTTIQITTGAGTYILTGLAQTSQGTVGIKTLPIFVLIDTSPPVLIKINSIPDTGDKLGYETTAFVFACYDILTGIDMNGFKLYIDTGQGFVNFDILLTRSANQIKFSKSFQSGQNSIKLLRQDKVGNVGTYLLTFYIDLENTTTPHSKSGNIIYTNKTSIDLSGTTSLSNYTLQLYQGDSIYQMIEFSESEWTLNDLPSKGTACCALTEYNIRALNHSDSSYSPFAPSLKIYYDTTNPKITMISPSGDTVLKTNKINVSGYAMDAVSPQIYYSIIVSNNDDNINDSQLVTTGQDFSETIQLTSSGTSTVIITVWDLAGNQDQHRIYIYYAPGIADDSLENFTVYPNPFKPNDGDDNTGKDYSRGDRPVARTNANSGIIFSTGTVCCALTIKIYSILGRLIFETNTQTEYGKYQWDVKDSTGADVASGVYIYVVTNESGEIKTGKIGVIR